MASIQERSKLKRVSYDTWSTREQLCLASSVLKSGDQNWICVSRSLKPFTEKEALRPPDWFSQKSCAMQYSILLENADTSKRKKRDSGETTGESIVKRLTQERIAELGQILAFQRDEYQQLKAEVNLLRSGMITEEKLQKMWLSIEQEERDQEQKARAHTAWLAKRQQKQEVNVSPQTITLASPHKTLETSCGESQETNELMIDEEEKKDRGGRSPLLTSLLKSPSPTTQMQTPTCSAQVSSPTIASLLGSSPKVPNMQTPTNIPAQLHQLVSNAITNAIPERPSVEAPTLSMLLELPANLQRGSLASLQQAVTNAQQQIAVPELDVQSHLIEQTPTKSETAGAKASAVVVSMPADETMVQIIDRAEDVIRKDIMSDVINKDEINEIIGDLEELIKEEITATPPTTRIEIISTGIPVAEKPSVSKAEKVMFHERPEPRDVDEPVSLSNSPQSEMAIDEIDQSTSSIAEIIGTVAIEPVEPKIAVVSHVAKELKPNEEDTRVEDKVVEEMEQKTKFDEKTLVKTDKPFECDIKAIIQEDRVTENTDKQEKLDDGSTQMKEQAVIAKKESKTGPIVESTSEKLADEKGDEAEVAETVEMSNPVDETIENAIEDEDSPEEIIDEANTEFDQIELNLAKITGDENDAGSAEVVSVCSEVTTDVPSLEGNEKSQDISMILEDDESSESNSSKKKGTDEHSLNDTMIDGSDSQESLKNEFITKVTAKETTYESSTDVDCAKAEVHTEKISSRETKEPKESDDIPSPETVENEKKEIMEETKILSEAEDESGQVEKTDTYKMEKKEDVEKKVEYEKHETKGEEDLERTELEASLKLEVEESEESQGKKCLTPMSVEGKTGEEVERDTVNSIKQLQESEKEDIDVKEERVENKNATESEFTVKKETVIESSGSICDDIGDLDEEESSLSKLSGGRAMKTYSKKQTIAVDSEPENESSGENADYRAWKKAVMLVYNRLATHKYASVFLRPITEDQAPGYHSVIFRPMDLSTIKKNIDNGTIRSTMHFQRDVMIMFQNAIMYNKQDTFVYKMAVSMQEECLQHMQILVQVTGEGQLRRETRTAASSSSETSDSSMKRKRSHITPSPHDTDSPRGKKRRKSEND